MLLWAATLSLFSNLLPQSSQENWYPAAAPCFFMCQLREAFWRHVKPHTSHLAGGAERQEWGSQGAEHEGGTQAHLSSALGLQGGA